MATPHLTKFTVPGALGSILVDVRAPADPSPRPAVLVWHGFKGFKDWGMFPPLADRLAKAGFTAVSFNASGSGVDDDGNFGFPERFGHNTFTVELADMATLLAALDHGHLGVAPPSSIGLVGHSRGGGLAVLAADRWPRIATLVTWAAVATVERWGPRLQDQWRRDGVLPIVNARTGESLPLYPDVLDDVQARGRTDLDIGQAASRLAIPWLILHGAADEAVPVAEADQLHRASNGRAVLQIVEQTGHTFGAVHPFAGITPALETVVQTTVAFLGRHLR